MSILITNKASTSSSGSSNSFQTFTNLGLTTSVASSALTIALKQQDGATDPAVGTGAVIVPYRSSTSASGAYTNVSSTAAQSVVVPSGATLGMVSGQTGYLWVYAMNNAGTTNLGVSFLKFDDGSVQSSTAITSGATVNNIIYSTSALTNVPIRLIARLKVLETTAGTWSSAATEISLAPAIFPEQTISAYYNTATGAGYTNAGTVVPVNFDAKVQDDLNCVTTGASTWQFTVPVAGLYSASSAIQFSRSSVVTANNTTFTLYVTINNAIAIIVDDFNFSSTSNVIGALTLTGSTPLFRCAIGDFIQIRVSNTNAVGNPTLSTDATRNWVSIQRVGN